MSCPCEAAEAGASSLASPEDAPWCPGTTAHERGRGGRGPQAPVAPGTIRTGERPGVSFLLTKSHVPDN